MDSEIERFRVNPELRQRAAEVCVRHGHELSDVLRQLIRHLGETGMIPFDMPEGELQGDASVALEEDADWLTPNFVAAEFAVALLDRFIATCTSTIDDAAVASQLSAASPPTKLMRERETAIALRRSLDLTDRASVQAVIDRYGPLVAPSAR